MAKTIAQLEQLSAHGKISLPAFNTYTVRNSIFESMDISGNMVSIESKNGIVHTKWDSFRGTYIVPMKKGRFKAKVTFMCAEYEDLEETEVSFVCE